MALELTRTLGDMAREADVLARLGMVLATRALCGEALGVLDEAAALYRAAGDVEGYLRTTAKMGRVHFLQGTMEEGVARIQPLLRTSQIGQSEGRARVYVALAMLLFSRDRLTEAVEAAEQGSSIALALGENSIRAEAEVARAEALSHLRRFDEAALAVHEGIRLAEEIGDLYCLARGRSAAGD